jgi:MFS transporter, OPA family, sugar phosphate sensor protein UhpC
MNILGNRALFKWVVLFACILVYSTSHLVRWNYSSVTKYLIEDLHIGKPELGIIGAAFFYVYGLFQIPWGIAADKWGGRKVMPFAIVILGFFLAGFAFSGSYTQVLFWRGMMGIFSATGYVAITSVLAKWFTVRERGMAMNVFSGVGGGFGEILAFLLIPILSVVMTTGMFGLSGWRASTIVMGAFIVLIGVVSYFMLRSDPTDLGLPSIQAVEDKDPHMDYGEAAKQALKSSALWILSIVYTCYLIFVRLAPAWFPLYGTEYYIERGMGKEMAIIAGGVMATSYVMGRVVGAPVVGQISDILLRRYGVPRTAVMAFCQVAAIVIFWLLTLHMDSAALICALAFVGGSIFNSFPLVNAALAEMLTVKASGFSMAAVNTVGQFGAATALLASGFMADYFAVKGGAFHTAFIGIWYLGIMTAVVGLVAALVVIGRERATLAGKEALLHKN